jgi:hypothetical protein
MICTKSLHEFEDQQFSGTRPGLLPSEFHTALLDAVFELLQAGNMLPRRTKAVIL